MNKAKSSRKNSPKASKTRRRIGWILLVLGGWLFSFSVLAADSALNEEERLRALSKELRCLVCQNQSLEDSDAPLAQDLRRLVRERVQQGDSDDAIRAYLVQRYGDYVLLVPPVRRDTLVLWISPFLFLALGGIGVFLWWRRKEGNKTPPLTEEEKERLARLMKEKGV